jgi:chorismate-pyruvate lyase
MKNINADHLVLASDIIDDLIDLKSSTTVYLEALRKSRMNVQMIDQHLDGELIIRVTKLYFSSFYHPLIYSVSTIYKNLLTMDEYKLIMAEDLPLGRIFIQLNGLSAISKTNISIVKDMFPRETQSMNLAEDPIYRKSYNFMVGRRNVATIDEFFNIQSVQRF